MPLVEFTCDKCGIEKESLVKSTYDVKLCDCGATMRRMVGKTSFSLKGKGWFKDGYSN